MSTPRNILTIATGKMLYLDMAINLARSFRWWNKDNGITFHLATDMPDNLPVDVEDFVSIIKLRPDELGKGFSSKLHLDKLAPAGQTLFIDSDCLVFGDLSKLFTSFKGKAVSVLGNYISSGEWFGDIGAICKKFKVTQLPKFNGGLYYVESGELANTVYTTARELEQQYDEIGFVRLRDRPNDEVIMALAMQLHAQTPLIDDGTVMSDPQACPGGYNIDVIKGERWLLNPQAPHPLHQGWYPFVRVSPLIVHFLGYYTMRYPYRREVYRLSAASTNKSYLLSGLYALLTIEYPERLADSFKTIFRSTYHKLFGVRKIKTSERVISQ
ncbi:hypothetical protein [Mucilaginibacter myungsuensis]|uniref:Uncharacterized protein n=1 Tax=Mucilaginibacter myungsuensis TaxID=649104 RepID=A0A929KVU7_9SPHI|nr:hypothetical protein [Mucilaginibacter myungsuensis]MBE9660833.1 hypothetical protein [Mucilaginibacter myungsuensis]MDN3600880.1 hypothetical protein [Mucilaginibacter myungsuensis]